MNWEFEENILGAISFLKTWESPAILLSISSVNPPAWRRAGHLIVEVPIDGELFKVRAISVEHGNSLIDIPYSGYRLTFEPSIKLLISSQNAQIKVAQFNTNMINYPSTTPRETGAVVTVTKPSVTVSTELAPANVNRHTGAIYNNTTKSIGIAFGDNTATLAKPSKVIPAGGNLEIYTDYTGVISYICPQNATGDVLLETVSYL